MSHILCWIFGVACVLLLTIYGLKRQHRTPAAPLTHADPGPHPGFVLPSRKQRLLLECHAGVCHILSLQWESVLSVGSTSQSNPDREVFYITGSINRIALANGWRCVFVLAWWWFSHACRAAAEICFFFFFFYSLSIFTVLLFNTFELKRLTGAERAHPGFLAHGLQQQTKAALVHFWKQTFFFYFF